MSVSNPLAFCIRARCARLLCPCLASGAWLALLLGHIINFQATTPVVNVAQPDVVAARMSTDAFVVGIPEALLPTLHSELATRMPKGMRIAWDADDPSEGTISFTQSSLVNLLCCGGREQNLGGVRIATPAFQTGAPGRETFFEFDRHLPQNLNVLLARALKEAILATLEDEPDDYIDNAECILDEQVKYHYDRTLQRHLAADRQAAERAAFRGCFKPGKA